MERAVEHLLLLLLCQLDEMDGIARHPDGQVRIVVGVLHGIEEHVAVEDINVDVMPTIEEVAIYNVGEVGVALLITALAQEGGHQGERVGNAVQAVSVRDLGHALQAGKSPHAVAAMHWIGTRGKGLPGLAAIGRGASLPAVDNIAGNSQQAQCGHGAPIAVLLAHPLREGRDHQPGDLVGPLVVVAVLREVALNVEVHHQPIIIQDRGHLGIFHSTQ
mmetsp:Transcript_16804/g.46970  ORF Transcript_16804/g.46970 Transcript_16804/m.46970 type:complete len:218 (+) Transcript_16804:251-904(+)